jgi:hypothetical protein
LQDPQPLPHQLHQLRLKNADQRV